MQDRTINNALLALYRKGEGMEHVEALMAMRGVQKPAIMHDRPLSRRKSAVQRAYMALLRLETAGVVKREGRVWSGVEK